MLLHGAELIDTIVHGIPICCLYNQLASFFFFRFRFNCVMIFTVLITLVIAVAQFLLSVRHAFSCNVQLEP